MKKRISISGLIGALIVAAVLGGLAQAQYGFVIGMATFVLAMALAVGKPWFDKVTMSGGAGAITAAITREVWQDHIEGNLFKENEFLLATTNASQYVLQGKVVHIPQAGGLPTVVMNRSSLPANVTTRTDTDVTYDLDAYTTDPIKLANAETYELSYNKRESVLTEHETALRERIADGLLIKFAPTTSTRIMRTSGDAADTHLTGTTGTRKKLTVNDLKKASLMMNKQKVAKADRYALLSADMYNQLTDDMSQTQYRDFSAAMDVKNGVVGMLFGFKIMQRSDVVVYNEGALAVNAYGAVNAATDNDAVLCWQKAAIEHAVGSITFFENTGDPTYYGDIYSFEVRMGGRIRRSDQVGLVAIVQEA